jgi:hypothetical protein
MPNLGNREERHLNLMNMEIEYSCTVVFYFVVRTFHLKYKEFTLELTVVVTQNSLKTILASDHLKT